MNDRHLELSSYIKSVHEDLRKKFRNSDEESLWEEHVKDEVARNNYAKSMHELATSFWEQNNSITRIEWIYQYSRTYFHEGRLEEILMKENKKLSRNGCSTRISRYKKKLKLLDVGSCYNPFGKYDELDVLAIDLSPATKEVRQCDFLSLRISDEENSSLNYTVKTLTRSSFDIIVFSLLLEYFPSSKQRHLCCKNASDLLMPSGLLFIITPDSKHQNHNSKMMKSWKEAMLHLNLVRVKYEKLAHIHCMAFRKVPYEIFRDAYSVQDISNEKIHTLLYIPQDSNKHVEKTPSKNRTQAEDKLVSQCFAELPFL